MTTPTPELDPLAVRLAELGDRTARQVLDVLAQVRHGIITLDDVPGLASLLVQLGAEQAAALTVGDLTATLAAAAGPGAELPAPASGTASAAAAETAIATVLAGPEDHYETRLSQLARGAVARSGQDARQSAVRSSQLVSGWSRGLDSSSCELCRWWWRDGRVWPKEHHMPRHPGCTCVQVPELVEGLGGVSQAAYQDSNVRRELDRRGRYLAAFGSDRRHASSDQ